MPMVGETLAGRYRIDAALGAGATAVVYRARDLRLERDVAIKVLLPNLARDPLIAGRFDREARALAAVPHPGIVSVFDVDRGDPATGREPFFVMELCENGSLADALDESGGRLSPETLAPMLVTVADGLAALHARGVIHRDVKPHNILICGGRAKLADFGLARRQDATRLTAEGTGAGTLAYLAPELLAGAEPGPAADVYALGVVAFQGLTGRLPRRADSMVDLVDTRLAPVAPVSSLAPAVGTAFDSVVGAALAPEPAYRPPPTAIAAGLHQALMQWRTETHALAGAVPVLDPNASTQQVRLRPPPPPPRIARSGARGRRRSVVGPLLAGSALAVLAVIVVLLLLQAGAAGPTRSPSPSPRSTAAPTSAPSPASSPTSTSSPLATASASPTPSPTQSPTPSPVITLPPTPVVTQPPTTAPTAPPIWSPSQARTSLANVYTAIENAEGIFSFSDPRDAVALRSAADDVQKPLDKENQKQTARAAQALSRKLQEIVDAGRLANDGELRQTVANLVAAAGPP